MALNSDAIVRQHIGEMVIQQALTQAQLVAAQEEIADLKAKLAKYEPDAPKAED